MSQDFKETDNLKEQAKALDEKLKRFKKINTNQPEEENVAKPSALAEGLKYTTDFASGPIVGVIIGYAFDKHFETSPWGLLFFLLLGFAAGVLNLYKSSQIK